MAAVAVVGAGVAGLAAACRLQRMGIRVVLYESEDRVGGAVRTERRDGFLAELGPNSISAQSPQLDVILEALGLTPRLRPAAPEARSRYIARVG